MALYPFIQIGVFFLGLALVIGTFFSALSTFVLPRPARTRLNQVVFGVLRWVFEILLRFTKSYTRRDAIMAYYAPVGLMLLVPVWYTLIAIGYAAMYWALGVPGWQTDFILSGSSLLTIGIASSENIWVNILTFTEATFGLVLVALLIAYLPTMYSAFSRREQAVNLLEVRAGNPPSAVEMILAVPPHPRPGTPQRLLAGLGGLVCGRRGEPQRLAGPGVFPFAALVEFLGGSRRDGDGRRLADPFGSGYSDLGLGAIKHPGWFSSTAPHLRLFWHRLPTRSSLPARAGQHQPRRVRRRPRFAGRCRRPAQTRP